jgi:N-acetyl-gamma-glutamyl-phosphate reductase
MAGIKPASVPSIPSAERSTKTRVPEISSQNKIRIAVFGATGYTGIELLRLLVQHSHIEIGAVTSEHYAGKRLSEVYPSFVKKCDLTLEPVDVKVLSPRFDLAFTALPHGVSMKVVSELVAAGKRVIDLSADFRLHDADVYARWYRAHQAPELLSAAVYGLTELHRKEVAQALLIAVPGCYPTAAILGLAPLVTEGIVSGDIVIDAKSGVTGAGRSSAVELSFSEVNENFKAYNVGVHRHTPEIDQELTRLAKKPISVLFVPHLLPMNRGILSTMYVGVQESVSNAQIERIYGDAYGSDPFIQIRPAGTFPQTKDVRGTNNCAIGYHCASRSSRLIVISCIDNLVKGAGGQAIQNMNLMYGLSETEGLQGLALVP